VPLISRVVPLSDTDSLTQALRDVFDSKPIGPVQMTATDKYLVLLFDVSVGNQLTTGTNAAIGTTATQLTTTPSSGREIIVQAAPTNTANVNVGGQAGQNLVLVPGAALSLDWTDVSVIWASSASGTQVVNWMVRG
jgi:hypothetical protein